MAPPTILAAIDIGTLTCRLIIAEVHSHGQFRVLQSERRILRLGERVDRDRRLRREAMDRVLQVLKEWRHVIDGFQAAAMALVATSAVRDATNREEFIERVKRDVGFEVEVITGEEEARRTLLGIRSGLPSESTTILAVDIGGGSTEFILDGPPAVPLVRSIDVGVVRLSERVLRSNPPTPGEVSRAREWIQNEVRAAVGDMGRIWAPTFVGTAGTITSLAAMAQKLAAYEPARVHNYTLTLRTVVDLESLILQRRHDQRRGMPGLEEGREEAIAAGAIIVRSVMETLGMSALLVSDYGLREGLLIHLARQTGLSR